MEHQGYWPQEYLSGLSQFNNASKTRTVDIGEHKLALPNQESSQHPIERFNYGEHPLPVGLLPNPVHEYHTMTRAALPGLTFSSSDPDAGSWHSSAREDDRNSLSTESTTTSAYGQSAPWNQPSQLAGMTDYQPNSLPIDYQESPTSPSDSSVYHYRTSQVIDPSLTLNQQGLDYLGYKETPVKFEFNPPCFLTLDDGEYEREPYSPESPHGVSYHHHH